MRRPDRARRGAAAPHRLSATPGAHLTSPRRGMIENRGRAGASGLVGALWVDALRVRRPRHNPATSRRSRFGRCPPGSRDRNF